MTVFQRLSPLEPIFNQPKLQGSIDPGATPSDRLTLITTFTASLLNGVALVEFSGTNLIAVTLAGRLYVVDLSNPASPSVTGSVIANISGANSMHVVGDYVYITARSATYPTMLIVIDISTPSSPTEVYNSPLGDLLDLDEPLGVVVDGGYAYVVSNRNEQLTVLDVSTPSAPTVVATASSETTGGRRGPALLGDHVYWAVGAYTTIQPVDVSTPTSPSSVASTAIAGADFVISDGARLFVAARNDRVHAVDASTPSALTILDTITDSVNLEDVLRLAEEGGYVFATCSPPGGGGPGPGGGWYGRLTVLDASDPSNLSVIESYVDTGVTNLLNPTEVAVSLPTAVVGTTNGISIFRFV